MAGAISKKTTAQEHNARLDALRGELKQAGVDGFLVPVTDEFQNEYTPPSSQRLTWLTGFTGSAGIAAVTADKAAIFVDGRYTLQAKNQLKGQPYDQLAYVTGLEAQAWAAGNLKKGQTLGVDSRLHSSEYWDALEKTLSAKGIQLRAVDNLVDRVWADRPAVPSSPIKIQEDAVAGESSKSKRERLAAKLQEKGIDRVVITDQASIAWLLNIRGNDVAHTPLALSFAVLNNDGLVQWYVDESRVDDKVKAHLGADIMIQAPGDLAEDLSTGGAFQVTTQYDSKRSPVWFREQLKKAGDKIVEADDPCLLPKALKNDVEIEGIRQAHIRDGVALTKFLVWLDEEANKRDVTELEVESKLLEFRQAQDKFQEPSFATIAGSADHGAIVHYKASEESNQVLKKDSIFLLDSGGQYLDGTTDVTRTTVIGEPTDEQKKRFTQVLKGHINLGAAVFPRGTSGGHLDILARKALWADDQDYAHGTGHGVGAYLGVHEGPQRIAQGAQATTVPLEKGMVISNEPGFYKEGEFGIRIESLVVVKERPKPTSNSPTFYEFETVTMAPIDRRLVDPTLLTQEETQWLDAYHQKVFDTLSPHLNEKETAWLKEMTRPFAEPSKAQEAGRGSHAESVVALRQQGAVSGQSR